MAGFSDIPITLPPDAPTYYGTFEAKYVTKYLEDYVDNHVYNGRTLRSSILFGHRVEDVQKRDGFWSIHTQNPRSGERIFKSSKLVVAAGLTSRPQLPSLPNQQEFKGPIRHHKHFGEVSKSLLNTPECKHIAVLGGGKSATDMVYESVKKGKSVSWIIRKNGEGPGLFLAAPAGGRYENSIERGSTRLMALFNPSSFMPITWLARLVHGTSFGRNYLSQKTQAVDQKCRDAAAYRTREGALSSFRNLECTAS